MPRRMIGLIPGTSGTVTSVTGTANQIDVANGTTTPVLSIDSTFTFPGTVTNNLSIFGATTSAQLAGVISDETGSGVLVFGTSPTLVTPTLGVATVTSVNKLAITPPATASTLVVADGKTFTASNTITLTATDGASLNVTNALTKSGTYAAGNVISAVGAGNSLLAAAGLIVTSNIFSTYNSIATVGAGVPFEPATVDLTAQSAAVSATNLYLPATTALYRITGYLKVTTAGTSSILGGTTGVVITYTDGTDSVAQSVTMSEASQSGTNLAVGSGNTGNSTTTVTILGPTTLWAKTGVQMQYAIGYSSTGTTMVYEAHLRVEQL